MTQRRIVFRETPDGPRVEVEAVAGFRLVGAAEPEPPAEAMRHEVAVLLRDAGVGPDEVISFSADIAGRRRAHVDWPDLAEHTSDPAYARLLALARLPLDRDVPELNSVEVDPTLDLAVDQQAHEDRELFAQRRALEENWPPRRPWPAETSVEGRPNARTASAARAAIPRLRARARLMRSR